MTSLGPAGTAVATVGGSDPLSRRMSRRTFHALAGGALVAGATMLPVARAAADDPRLAVGVFVPGAERDLSLLDAFEAMTGKAMGIVHWFQPWAYPGQPTFAPPDMRALAAVAARGGIPMVTWEAFGPVGGPDPARLATIPAGAFDAHIDTWAQGLRAFGQPIYLRPFHEMNFLAYPWAVGVNGNTAADLVAAWHYLHDRFDRVGADNVRWVWCPNPEDDRTPYRTLYPGDACVDWFGLDIYNGGTQFDWGGWQSPQRHAERSYRSLQALNPTKPVMLAEASSVEAGGDKGVWIADLFATLPRAMPQVRAILWFHDDWTHKWQGDPRLGNLPRADWRVDTSAAALHSFRHHIGGLAP